MSFALTVGQDGPAQTAEVVWSVNGQTYKFRSDNQFISWISTIFTIGDTLAGGGSVTNPLVLPNNTNAKGYSLNTLDNAGVGGAIDLSGAEEGTGAGGIIELAGYYDNSGGSISAIGGEGLNSPAGSINLNGGNLPNTPGGSINLASYDGTGGSIALYGGLNTTGAGGNITMIGGPANAGSIDLSSGAGANTGGGSIDLRGGGSDDAFGGSILANGILGSNASGGTLNMCSGVNGDGGDINTSGGGGYINTSNLGGGYIDTGSDGNPAGPGGYIRTRGFDEMAGGYINTSAGNDAPGGYIDTSDNGGYILTKGDGANAVLGGYIDTSAGSNFGGGAPGGFITTKGGTYPSAIGGSIDLRGGDGGDETGGNIIANALLGDNNRAGNLTMSSGLDGSGGDITTNNGGGSIDTTGVGSIGFGTIGTRTTLTGTATADRTQTLPNESGTIAVIRIASPNLDFPSIAGNGRATLNVTVASAEVGDAVLAVCTSARTGNFQQIIFNGFVVSANTVSVVAVNTYGSALDLPPLDFKIIVFKGI